MPTSQAHLVAISQELTAMHLRQAKIVTTMKQQAAAAMVVVTERQGPLQQQLNHR
jgi:hypothetical protein